MKKLKYCIYGAIGATALSFSLATCSQEDIKGISEDGLPLASEATVTVEVDQSINQATFNLEGNGIYPVWIMTWESANPYSTTNGYSKIINSAGDYVLNYRIGNRNGLSQGMGSVTFHIDNTIVNFDMYTALLSGKTWSIAKDEAGHLACGESGTDGTNWYSAQANEKESYGIYDDEVTFSADGVYTYSPGSDGLMFVNTGCTVFSENPNDGNDFDVAVEAQTTTYEIVGEGDDVYIVLPSGTYFPYISCDDQYNDPRFRIESISSSRLVLIYDNGEIAWHYILTSSGDDNSFNGFDADSDCNLFKNCTYTNSYYYAPGWSQISDPEITSDGNSYTISLPTATTDQWQAQVLFHTDMVTYSDNTYDFSCKLVSNTDHNNVTVKLCDTNNDGTYYFAETIKLSAYEEYVFYKSDMAGIDLNQIDVVFDFGGNAADTEITVSEIDLQEHGCDGIEAPTEEEDDTEYVYDASTNLWKTYVDDNDNYETYFYYAPGWGDEIDLGFSGTGGTYTISLSTATTDQWQAQVHIITNIPGEADTPYDFCCTMLSDKDLPGVTFKLTDTASDDNYFFAERKSVSAYEEYTFKMPAVTLTSGAANALKLVLDFGGCSAGTTVTVNNIVLQKTVQ